MNPLKTAISAIVSLAFTISVSISIAHAEPMIPMDESVVRYACEETFEPLDDPHVENYGKEEDIWSKVIKETPEYEEELIASMAHYKQMAGYRYTQRLGELRTRAVLCALLTEMRKR